RGARPDETNEPSRAAHDAERFDDPATQAAIRRKRWDRGAFDPRARRLADRERRRRARRELDGALREVSPANASDASLGGLARVGAEVEVSPGAPGDPGGARPSPGRGREERFDPARDLGS